MRVLYLATNLNVVGGKEQYDRNTISALRGLGAGIRVIQLLGVSFPDKILFVARVVLSAVISRPHMVFCGHISFSPIPYFLKRFLGIQYIVFTHGIEVWDIRRGMYKKALRGAKLVVAVSVYTEKKLQDQLPDLKGKIFILRNTADSERFTIKEKSEPLVERHDLKGKKVLLTVTRLYPSEEQKGYLRVIDALPGVRKIFPDTRYVIVGEGHEKFGDNRDRIREYARARGVEDCVILTGRVPDNELPDYYNACDVFIMPSTQEGFGIVFLEALACGKPVIAGNVDGSQEAVLGGELGILINPVSIEETEGALIEVLSGKAPGRFYDREFLRRRVIEAYGYERFQKNAEELLKLLR